MMCWRGVDESGRVDFILMPLESFFPLFLPQLLDLIGLLIQIFPFLFPAPDVMIPSCSSAIGKLVRATFLMTCVMRDELVCPLSQRR